MATSSILGVRPDNSSSSSSRTGPAPLQGGHAWASSTTGSLSPEPKSAPTRWPSDPGHSTARRESTSRNPPGQQTIPPGCVLCGLLYRRQARSAPLPKAGQSELEASTPRTSGLVLEGATLLIAPPSTTSRFSRQPGFEAGPRLASLDAETKTKVPAQARQARHLVPSLDDERVYGPGPTHRRLGPRQHLGQLGSSLRTNQIALPNAQHTRSAASGDATSRCPIHGRPRR